MKRTSLGKSIFVFLWQHHFAAHWTLYLWTSPHPPLCSPALICRPGSAAGHSGFSASSEPAHQTGALSPLQRGHRCAGLCSVTDRCHTQLKLEAQVFFYDGWTTNTIEVYTHSQRGQEDVHNYKCSSSFFFLKNGVWFTSSAPRLISGEKNKFSVVRQSLEEFLRHVGPVSVQTNMCTRKWQLEIRETLNWTILRIISYFFLIRYSNTIFS